MAKKKATIHSFEKVMKNIIKMYNEETNKDAKKLWVGDLNEMLDNMRDNDFFGTEGQCDPRGDNRD